MEPKTIEANKDNDRKITEGLNVEEPKKDEFTENTGESSVLEYFTE